MTTFTVAGSYHEYFDFLQKKGLPRDTKEYTFFSDPTHLRSLSNVRILCVGEYFYKSPVYKYQYISYYKQQHGIRFVNQFNQEV